MGTKGSKRRRVAAVAALAVFAAVAALAGYRIVQARAAGKPAPPPAIEFAPDEITRLAVRALPRWLPVSGTLQAVNAATVKAKVSGDVRQVMVREGESVRAGQVLARIDTADLDAKLAERIGALEAARAQLALAEKTRQTNVALLKQQFISQNAFDTSESGFNVAKGGVKSAEAQVQLARNALRDAVAVAPIDGIVSKRHVQPGEKVAFDTPMITVVDLRQLELQAMVPALEVPEIGRGMSVELAVDGFDRRFAGHVDRINPATEPGTRAIVVYVTLPNRDLALKSGMFATGRIALASQSAVPTLPITAVRSEAGQLHVWTIDDGKLVRRSVAVGRRDEAAGVVEVKTVLPPDLPILAARFDNLKEGARVVVRTQGGSAGKAG